MWKWILGIAGVYLLYRWYESNQSALAQSTVNTVQTQLPGGGATVNYGQRTYPTMGVPVTAIVSGANTLPASVNSSAGIHSNLMRPRVIRYASMA